MAAFSVDSIERFEADLDALLDLDAAARANALARIELDDPERARALRTWLGAAVASEGLFEDAVVRESPALIERVGPWRLERLIGRGGSGEVFLGRRADGAFDREVAVKLLRPGRDADARIVSERRLLAKLDHPHIARLLDGGVARDGRPWLVTELIHGRTLDRWLAESKPSLEQRVRVFATLTDAVAFAHARGIVHGDIKPTNVIVDEAYRPHLVDFGVARIVADRPLGSLGLTPEWAAPELLEGLPSDTRSDVYALGLLFWWLLTTARPLESSGLESARFGAHLGDLPPPSLRAPVAERAAIRARWDTLVLECLARDPDRRPADAGVLAEALRPSTAREPRYPVGASRRSGGGRWLTILLIAVLLGALVWQQFRIAELERRLERSGASEVEAHRAAVRVP